MKTETKKELETFNHSIIYLLDLEKYVIFNNNQIYLKTYVFICLPETIKIKMYS